MNQTLGYLDILMSKMPLKIHGRAIGDEIVSFEKRKSLDP